MSSAGLRMSLSEDVGEKAVQATNDDAQLSKASCAQLGYFQDEFVKYFVKKPARRAPLINRGYYVRHKCLVELLNDFQTRCSSQGSGCQVLVLGAGFDTTYFQLKKQGIVFDKYVEIDFLEVTQKKCMTVSLKPTLKDLLNQNNEATISGSTGTITSPGYSLHAADLRHLDQVSAALDASGIDFSKPTFIVAECVLVYMDRSDSQALINWLGERFSTAAMAEYEQINPTTRFGEQMVKNLALRGAELKGIHATPTLEAHQTRFTENNWQRAFAADLNEIYRKHIDPVDRARIEGIEIFDEFEEWHMIMGHYSITVGVNDSQGLLSDFTFTTYAVPEVPALAPRGLSPSLPVVSPGMLPMVD